jgi:hypothetical protein
VPEKPIDYVVSAKSKQEEQIDDYLSRSFGKTHLLSQNEIVILFL